MKYYLILLTITIITTIILGYFTIPFLKKFKISQTILHYVKEHKDKNGTPTMGGLFIIIPIVVIFSIFKDSYSYKMSLVTIVISISFMIVGFIDDYLKIKLCRNLGLKPYQKIVFQLSVSLIASFFAFYNGLDVVFIPFTQKVIYLKYWCIPFYVLIFIALVNSVNLTDGLDGLCASVSFVFSLSVGIIILLELIIFKNKIINTIEYTNMALLSFITTGALLGYLLFNTNKASIFMGDTGSLGIGGLLSCLTIFTGNSFYIPIIGITFVFSSISVIIQVIYYKCTSKRIFLMAPLHHHYQEKGYSESKITYGYFLITLIVSLVCIIFLL